MHKEGGRGDWSGHIVPDIIDQPGESECGIRAVGEFQKQFAKYEDETRSIWGIIRSSSNVQKQLDAVVVTEIYETN